MERISFSRSKPWSDRLGKHTVIDVRRGKEVIGKITGRSGVGIPMMQYTLECGGVKPFTTHNLNAAKLRARTALGEA
jgi:hypothetical protein